MEDQKGHCIVKAPEDGVLTEAHIPELVEKLCDVCHKWKIFGIMHLLKYCPTYPPTGKRWGFDLILTTKHAPDQGDLINICNL